MLTSRVQFRRRPAPDVFDSDVFDRRQHLAMLVKSPSNVWSGLMTNVKALENAVRALPPQDLAEFRQWFTAFDLAAWDLKIEDDAATGKLDALLAEAAADYISGEPKPL